jgi:hypothetical protein
MEVPWLSKCQTEFTCSLAGMVSRFRFFPSILVVAKLWSQLAVFQFGKCWNLLPKSPLPCLLFDSGDPKPQLTTTRSGTRQRWDELWAEASENRRGSALIGRRRETILERETELTVSSAYVDGRSGEAMIWKRESEVRCCPSNVGITMFRKMTNALQFWITWVGTGTGVHHSLHSHRHKVHMTWTQWRFTC